MLYLNHPLLNTEHIISLFNQEVIHGQGRGNQTALQLFQNKLKAIYFEKHLSNHQIMQMLHEDKRFESYPKLQETLRLMIQCTEDDTEHTYATILDLKLTDWSSEDELYRQFHRINRQWQYFTKVNEDFWELYEQLVDSFRKISVLFEKNNNDDDTLAFMHAYKLTALFPNTNFDTLAKHFHKLVNRCANKQAPFYELLSVQLELPHADTFHDKLGWMKMILRYGEAIFPCFAMAGIIEEKNLGLVPQNLKTLMRLYALSQYRRAEEDPEFAIICHHQHVPESLFDDCLDYLGSQWPKKTKDNIPNVVVEVHSESRKFVWLKLPIIDKRALIIGHITDCCQSIGHHGETSVKDAVSLENSAIYVLLETKVKQTKPYLINGQINDEDYKIIGQSEVWRDITDNLCLDSFEFLEDSIPGHLLKHLFAKFAQSIVRQYPEIRLIHIGQGGRTPVNMFPEAIIEFEKKEGSQYIDSCEQSVLYSSLSENEHNLIYETTQDYPYDFIRCLYFLAQYHGLQKVQQQLKNHLERDDQYPQSLYWNKLINIIQVLGHIPQLDALTTINIASPPETYELTQLLMSINDLHQFIHVLTIAPESLRYPLLQSKDKYNMMYWILACKHPQYFKMILELIPPHLRLKSLKIRNIFNTVLQHAYVNNELLTIILTHISAADIKELIKIKVYDKTILEHAVYDVQNLMLIMNIFNIEQRRKLILSSHSDNSEILLFHATSQLKSLQYLMEHFNDQEQRDLLDLKSDSGKNLLAYGLTHPQVTQYILLIYPIEERLAQCYDIIGYNKLMTYIGLEPRFLESILSVLSDKDIICIVTHIAWYDKSIGLQNYVQQLFIIAKYYPQSDLEKLISHMMAMVPTLMHDLCMDTKTFITYWQHLSESQQQQVLNNTDIHQRGLLFHAINNPEVLAFIFNYYPLGSVLQKDHQGLDLFYHAISQPKSLHFLLTHFPEIHPTPEMIVRALYFPASLNHFLKQLSIAQRFQLIDEHKLMNKVNCAFNTENESIRILLEGLSFEQLLHLYKTQNGFQYLSLSDWKKLVQPFSHDNVIYFCQQLNVREYHLFDNPLIDDEIKDYLLDRILTPMDIQQKFQFCAQILNNHGKINLRMAKQVLKDKLLSFNPQFQMAAELLIKNQSSSKLSTLRAMYKEVSQIPNHPRYQAQLCLFSMPKAIQEVSTHSTLSL